MKNILFAILLYPFLVKSQATVDSMGRLVLNNVVGSVTLPNSVVTNTMLFGSIGYNKLSLAGSIVNADLAGSIDLATKVTGILPFASNAGTSAATSATTGTITVPMTSRIITIIPSGAATFNGTNGVVGQVVTFVITTSGVSSFVLTWGTNFRTTATLATGTTTAKIFCVSFICTNGTQWCETSRTAAM